MLGAGARSGEPSPGSRGDQRPGGDWEEGLPAVREGAGRSEAPAGAHCKARVAGAETPTFLPAPGARGLPVPTCEGARRGSSLGGREPFSHVRSPRPRGTCPGVPSLESGKDKCHLSCSSPASRAVSADAPRSWLLPAPASVPSTPAAASPQRGDGARPRGRWPGPGDAWGHAPHRRPGRRPPLRPLPPAGRVSSGRPHNNGPASGPAQSLLKDREHPFFIQGELDFLFVCLFPTVISLFLFLW